MKIFHKDELSWFNRGSAWANDRALRGLSTEKVTSMIAAQVLDIPDEFQEAFVYGVKHKFMEHESLVETRRERLKKATELVTSIFT